MIQPIFYNANFIIAFGLVCVNTVLSVHHGRPP